MFFHVNYGTLGESKRLIEEFNSKEYVWYLLNLNIVNILLKY